MSDDYYLKIGATDVFSEDLLADLSSTDDEKKKKAVSHLSERLKETRVRIGTLLKMDNVSFLIGAGASMEKVIIFRAGLSTISGAVASISCLTEAANLSVVVQ